MKTKFGICVVSVVTVIIASRAMASDLAGQKYRIDSFGPEDCFSDILSADNLDAHKVGDVVTLSMTETGVDVIDSEGLTQRFSVGHVDATGLGVKSSGDGEYLFSDVFQEKETDEISGGSERVTLFRSGNQFWVEKVSSSNPRSLCRLSAVN